MRSAIRIAAVLIAAAIAVLTATPPARCFPWSTDMFRSPAVAPLARTPRNQPLGALSEHGAESIPLDAAAATLHNPLSANPGILRKGHALFQTDCAPCHGNDAKGDGPVRFLLRVPPADLTNGMPLTLPDGYIYSTIRDGNEAMPPYGDTMSSTETWQLIIYLRAVQTSARAHASSR
jgi:mono/diheme cytochrome c family protein